MNQSSESYSDIHDYMVQIMTLMQQEYRRIQKRVKEDPGTAGDNGEENWADLLRKILPPTYAVKTKGRLMNEKGHCSPQIDILVLSPGYPPYLADRKEYIASGVVAAFECKLTLKAKHITDAIETSIDIHRNYSPNRLGTPFKELHSPILYGLLAHSCSWKATKQKNVDRITQRLHDGLKQIEHPKEMLDLLCISNLATWRASRFIVNPQHAKKLQQLGLQVNPSGSVEADYICFSQFHAQQYSLFTPIGTLYSTLLARLGWYDPTLRGMASEFVRNGIAGNAEGKGSLSLPINILSAGLIKSLTSGPPMPSRQTFTSIPSDEYFFEWSPSFFC